MSTMVWDVQVWFNHAHDKSGFTGVVQLGYVPVFETTFDPTSQYSIDEMKRHTQDRFAQHLRELINVKIATDALDSEY